MNSAAVDPVTTPGSAQAQLPLFDARSEAEAFHDPQRHGFFSLLIGGTHSLAQKKQVTHRLIDLPTVIGMVDPKRDTWISQAEFIKPNRRVVNLARIGLLYADLDTYRTEWAQRRSPEGLAGSILYFCENEGLPLPSVLVYSGRGIQAKWLLDGTIPRQELPRWNACQRSLVDRLSPLGADQKAKDASRVLRLVDTVNTKSGNVCKVVYVKTDADGEPYRYSFEHLEEFLTPVAGANAEEKVRANIPRRKLHLVRSSEHPILRGFSGRQLAWHRLEDLRKLAALRGGVFEGERMTYLMWSLNFLLLSGVTNSTQMYREAAEIAKEIDPKWNYRSAELMTLYAKAKQFEAGRTIFFAGKEWPALYTPKNDTLISIFRITNDEQRSLKTIISEQVARERHRARERSRRRAGGAVPRSDYEAGSLAKRKPWETLGMSRATWYRTGKPEPGSR